MLPAVDGRRVYGRVRGLTSAAMDLPLYVAQPLLAVDLLHETFPVSSCGAC